MGLFEQKRFVWNEPWFFQQRIRSATSWVLLALLLLGAGVGVGAALYWSVPAGGAVNWFEVVGLGLAAAAAVWWVLDGSDSRRQAILYEDAIRVGGDMGKYSSPTTYRLAEIPSAAIVLPAESRWPGTALIFRYKGEDEAIGIDASVSLIKLAQALHAAGVSVRLEGWQPNQESAFEKTFSWQAEASAVTARATMETLPPGTPGMLTPLGIGLALVRQSWAIVVWLLITAAAIYYFYHNWRNLDVIRLGLLILVPLGVMYMAGQYTDRFASAATSQGLTRMARRQIRRREGLQLDADADDCLPVDILQRDQFAKTVQTIHELGFVQADTARRRMLFEGRKQRWCIPAESIRSVAIEEVQSGTPGQSVTGALNYYVVVRFAGEDEQEFGFRSSQRDYGAFNDIQRAAGAMRVYEAFESVLKQS